jgi:glycine oxidase
VAGDPVSSSSFMTADVVIPGAGVIGLSIAWKAAVAGANVILCDPAPGKGASWAAAGMLAPVTEAHVGEEHLVHLNLAAAREWETFAPQLEAASGTEIGYTRCGTVMVAADSSDMAVVERVLAYHATIGLESSRLTSRQCRERVHALAPGVRGGASAPSDHQVDNRLLVGALETAARCAGAQITHAAVKSIEVSGGRATGVSLSDGRVITASAVVVATGCWTPRLEGVPDGVLPPVRPVKGHIMRLRGAPDLIDCNVRCIVHGNSLYLVPRRDGTIVVGATVEERGYDASVQAGAIYELLRDARTIIPGIAELELLETSAGLRPGSPDNGPFVGWTGVDGLAVATGHYRNGMLLAPITADAICDMLAGRKVSEFLEPFRADRMSGLIA